MSVSLQTVIVHLNGISRVSPRFLERLVGLTTPANIHVFQIGETTLALRFVHTCCVFSTPYVIVHVLSNGGSASVRAPGTS